MGKIYKKKSHQGVERKVCVLQKIILVLKFQNKAI